MVVKTESIPHDGGFIASEAPGSFSRDRITLAMGQDLKAGTVLGKIINGAATFEADAGNVGNGTLAGSVGQEVDVLAGAKPGVYLVLCVAAATDAGVFHVFDPDGKFVGVAEVGTAFATEIGFEIADDSVDFAAGDSFTITVAAGAGRWEQLDLTGTDGTEQAAGILFGDIDATEAHTAAAAIVRGPCEVQLDALTWPTGITDNQKAAALAELELLGIVGRAGPATVTTGANTAA